MAPTWHHKWECPPRSVLDRSAYQPYPVDCSNSDRLIYPPYIWVDTPTCDVKNQRWPEMKPLGMANHTHTWWYNSPLKCGTMWVKMAELWSVSSLPRCCCCCCSTPRMETALLTRPLDGRSGVICGERSVPRWKGPETLTSAPPRVRRVPLRF